MLLSVCWPVVRVVEWSSGLLSLMSSDSESTRRLQIAPGLAKMAKKSKKEKAAEKKAEQERLEAERLERERVEAERLEKERIEREHQERIRKEKERVRKEEEAARLTEQTTTNEETDRDRRFLLEQEHRKDSEGKEWRAYLECSELPDAAKEAEINTYIALWEKQADSSLEEAAHACEMAAELCSRLRRLASTYEERGEPERTPRLHSEIRALRRLTARKLDAISAHLCQHAEKDADGNMNVQSKAPNIDFGMWVNLARQPRTKEIDFPGITQAVKLEIPRQLALANIAVRVMHFNYDERAEASAAADFLALGGPFSIELLALPPAPKAVRQWTLRQVTALSSNVLRLPYPIPPGAEASATPGAIPPVSEAMIAAAPPIKVTISEPEGVLIRGQLHVGWWDATEAKWKQEGITDIERDAEAGTISFRTVRLTSLAFLQPRGFDLPFLRWSLAPCGENASLFTVTTPTRDIAIEIGEGVCRLVGPTDAPLQPLLGQPLEPLEFLHALTAAGIHLIPQDSDLGAIEGLMPKQRQFEEEVYAELGLAAPVASLKCSKWNRHNEFLALDDEGNYTPSSQVAPIRAVVQSCVQSSVGGAGAAVPEEVSDAAATAASGDAAWRCLLFTPQRDGVLPDPSTLAAAVEVEAAAADGAAEGVEGAPEEAAAAAAEEGGGATPEEGTDGAAPGVEATIAAATIDSAAEAVPAPAPETAAAAVADQAKGADIAVDNQVAAEAAGDTAAAVEEATVQSPLDLLPADRVKVCVLLSTSDEGSAFIEETLDDEGDVKERFHASVRNCLELSDEQANAVQRSSPLYTEAVRLVLSTLRVLSSTTMD
jgi:cancer susceptibility candidate protein 1